MLNNNLVVYTTIFGDYDELLDPKEKFDGCDFICFTDQTTIKSDIWDIKFVKDYDLPPNLMNRKYKILPHLFLSNYDKSLYIDANILILNNPLELANQYLSISDFALPKHFARNCIYEEAKECVITGKSKFIETNKQIEFYRYNGFPKKYGLGENNILFRNHKCENIINTMNEWWHELLTHTTRDQLSLFYIFWKNSIENVYLFEYSINMNKFFIKKNHKNLNNNIFKKFSISIIIRFKRIIINFLSKYSLIKL